MKDKIPTGQIELFYAGKPIGTVYSWDRRGQVRRVVKGQSIYFRGRFGQRFRMELGEIKEGLVKRGISVDMWLQELEVKGIQVSSGNLELLRDK